MMVIQREPRDHATPIAVVGVSALFPGSTDVRSFWRDIVEGRDQIEEVPPQYWLVDDYYDEDPTAPDKTYGKRGAFLSDTPFDPLAYGVPPNAVQQTDTSQLLGMIVAQKVLEDAAGGPFGHLDKSRISVILGATGTTELAVHLGSRLQRPVWLKALRDAGIPEDEAQDACNRIADSYVPWTEASFPGLLGNVIAGRIANKFDLGGTNCVVDAACASSLSAMAMGLSELYTDQSDMVIVGGVDTLNDILMYMCFSKTPALSASGDCRPFSEQADGTILGEGLGMLALRRLEDAEEDGDRIYAVIRGLGSSSDGKGTAIYAPKASGQAHALRRAYEAAGYEPGTVELLEAHGTATKAGDLAEFTAAGTVFAEGAEHDDDRQWCAIGSVKSQIGHTKGAAGAASLIKTVMALHHKVLPPTIKVDRPNSKLNVEESPFYINTEARPWVRDENHPRRAAVSSFGFGGSNFHVTLEEYTGKRGRKDRFRASPTELFLISGASGGRIIDKCRQLTDGFDEPGDFQFLARETQVTFLSTDPHRLAVVARDFPDLLTQLTAAMTAIRNAPDQAQDSPAGWRYSGHAPMESKARVAFLFPGQGSQYVGMGGDIAQAFPAAQAIWDEAADMEFELGDRLHEIVYPIPVFSKEDRAAQELRLRETEWAQPGIGVTSLTYLSLMEMLGIEPDCVGGHSFGEVTALHAGGALDQKAFLAVARKRGELMAEAAAMFPGAMTAIFHNAEKVGELLAQWNTGVVVANHNGPEQVVISGIESAIDATETKLKAAGIRFLRLPVSTAFHSSVVRPAATPFRSFLDHVHVNPPRIPVYANSTAAVYSSVVGAVRKTLASQIAQEVRFSEEIDAMYAAGVRTFIEVGPGRVLSSLVASCLGDRAHNAVSLDRKGHHGLTSLWHGVAQLAIAGVHMQLARIWDDVACGDDPRARVAPRMTIGISGVNYNKPYPPENGSAGLPAPNPVRKNGYIEGRSVGTEDHREVSARASQPMANIPIQPTKTASARPAVAPVAAQKPAAPIERTPAPVVPAPTPVTVAPTPAPVAAAPAQPAPAPIAQPNPMPAPPSGESLQWVNAFQQLQQQTVNAHMAFLQVAEQSMKSLETMLTGAPVNGNGADAPIQHAPMQSAPAMRVAPSPTIAQGANGQSVAQPAPAQPVAPSPAPVVQAAPPVIASPVAPAAPAQDLHAIMLAVVTEKTGYPTEMLEMGMSLDTDLGIDSIKRVEILSAVREQAPELPEFDMNEMGSLNTLGEIVEYMDERLPTVAAPAVVPLAPAVPAQDLHAIMLAVVTEKTGYPTEMLDMAMSLDTDLGIDSIKRVEILSAVREQAPTLPEFDMNEMGALNTLGEIVDYMDAKLPATSAPMAVAQAVPAAPAQDLHAIMLAVVTEKTGYPTEMLDMAMSLDTDLGIDSIKRVEILSAVREQAPTLPEFDMAEMGALNTLGEIVDYMDAKLPAATAPAVVAQAAPAAPAQDLHAIMLAVVTEKTGYPTEMLDLAMSLDTDLGIDSIKRVEILSAVREQAPELPEFDMAEMGALNTLGEIVEYMDAKLPSAPAPATAPAPTAPSTATSAKDLHAIMLAVVTEKTGYPTEMLDLAMSLDTDLGIDSIKRVEILSAVREQAPELPEFDMAEMGALNTLGEIVEYMNTSVLGPQNVNGAATPVSAPEAAAAAETSQVGRYALAMTPRPAPGLAPPWLLDGTFVHVTNDGGGVAPALVDALNEAGVNAVLAAEPPADAKAVISLAGLRNVADEAEAFAANQEVFQLATQLAPGFGNEGGLFVTVQDTGGDFGLVAELGPNAWLGGLSGLAKTAAQEWPNAVVRTLDVGRGDQSAAEIAARLAQELLNGGTDLEIGLPADGRRISFDSVMRAASGGAPIVDNSSVIVVSGGARGVTATALIELAKEARPKLALLGRSALAEESPALQAIQDDAGLKMALLAEAKEKGEKVTPIELGAAAHRIQASREIRATLQAMQAAGSEAIYLPCDVTDVDSTAAALQTVRERWGPVTGFVHGAGVLADKVLAEKTDDDFQRVFGTKVNGLRALLAATADDPLNMICLFSSVAARTGNAGQADYAMANEVLNRVANAEARRRGIDNCVVKSIGWGPWAGGMVTPVLKAKFEELGVPLIPLDEGAQAFVDELQAADRSEVEVVIGGMPKDGPLLSATSGGESMNPTSYAVSVSAQSHPELRSHMFNGTVVLPLVTVQDWFLRAANAWGGNGVEFGQCSNLNVRKGVPLPDFENEPAHFRIELQPQQLNPAVLTATLFDDEGVARFVAQVSQSQVSQGQGVANDLPTVPSEWASVAWTGNDLYGTKLFHGPDFAAIEAVDRIGEQGAQATLVGSKTLHWRDDGWAIDPALIDAGLQLARVWGVERLHQLTLPTTIKELTLHQPGLIDADARVRCILRGETIGQAGTRTDLWFVDATSGVTIAEIRGLEMYVSSEQPISEATTADAL